MSLLAIILIWFSFLVPKHSATDLAVAIASEVSSRPPLFKNDDRRIRTAALMTSVAFRESTFRHGVTGDRGNAHCEFQLWNAPKEVDTNHQLCTSIAFDRLKESIAICGMSNPLGIYASGPGGCQSTKAKTISGDRMHIARTLEKMVME